MNLWNYLVSTKLSSKIKMMLCFLWYETLPIILKMHRKHWWIYGWITTCRNKTPESNTLDCWCLKMFLISCRLVQNHLGWTRWKMPKKILKRFKILYDNVLINLSSNHHEKIISNTLQSSYSMFWVFAISVVFVFLMKQRLKLLLNLNSLEGP